MHTLAKLLRTVPASFKREQPGICFTVTASLNVSAFEEGCPFK
ncbi:hypothetical protein DOT_3477 [Desulfosporosinus sp. OT]|nr:hypothetical protein DOT_3477 [Desulfosporosinus sp. OT]